jgi:serine/threonine-protein kinase
MNFWSKLLELALIPFVLLARFIGHCNRAFRKRWWFSLLVAMLLLSVHLYQRFHRLEGKYAAIAYSPSTGVYNSAAECSSLAEAEQLARSRCNESDARVIAWSHNAWCALALSQGDNAYGIGWGHTNALAERLALEHCGEHTKKSCYVAIAVGADSKDEPPTPDGIYAAIAYSPSTGRHGVADRCTNVGDAERLALQSCDAPDGRVVVWANHDWCALAVGEDKCFGFAWGRSRDEVEHQALEHCREYTKTPCHIAAVVFAGASKEHRGSENANEIPK